MSPRSRSYPRLLVVVAAMALALGWPTSVAAVAPNTTCYGDGSNFFDGGPISTTTAFPGAAGAEAAINTVSPLLCSTSTGIKGSGTWVAVGNATDPEGWSIYQVGILKCVGGGGVCDGVNRLFYAWGRQYGVGGCTLASHAPVATSLGTAPTGTHTYTVIKTNTVVQFQLDGSTQTTIGASNICWPATGVRYSGETFDRGDQMGGTVGVHQQISNAIYYKSGLWHSPSFTGCTSDLVVYVCSRVNGQRVDIWTDRS